VPAEGRVSCNEDRLDYDWLFRPVKGRVKNTIQGWATMSLNPYRGARRAPPNDDEKTASGLRQLQAHYFGIANFWTRQFLISAT
jgi:hypothetical protein